MKSRTFKIILLLIGLLFLNIEAAQAGLVIKLKALVGSNFPYLTFIIVLVLVSGLAFFFYALFDKSLNINERQTKENNF